MNTIQNMQAYKHIDIDGSLVCDDCLWKISTCYEPEEWLNWYREEYKPVIWLEDGDACACCKREWSKDMHWYDYQTGMVIRPMTPEEETIYLAYLETDTTHTGAMRGDFIGLHGMTVYGL